MANAKKKKSEPGSGQSLKTVLHMGISSAVPERLHASFSKDQWQPVRMDNDVRVKPDITGTLADMKAVKTGSMDAIWCHHLLQRFFLHDVEQGLRECYRVLKENGFLLMALPDGQTAGAYLANNKPADPVYQSGAGPISALDMLYGYGPALRDGKLHLAHRSAFTADMLGLMLRDSGFTNIRLERKKTEIQAVAYKLGYDNPERVERVIIAQSDATKALPKVAPVKAAENTSTPVQKGKDGLTDSLDMPPALWKPLGLKK